MISPEGLVINPRIPASCLICAGDPRAPESDIIQTELIGTPGFSSLMTLTISSATFSEQLVQASTSLLYFSRWVISPSWYCCSYSLTCSCTSATRVCLASGMIRSSLPNEMPALHAWVKPKVISRSQKITVSFWPQKR